MTSGTQTAKRWLLWNVRCLRGRRCANVTFSTGGYSTLAGVSFKTSYTCGGCGTNYITEGVMGPEGCVIPFGRVRG